MAECPHKCPCTSDDECPHECTCVCAHESTHMVVEDLGPMEMTHTGRGLEVVAKIIGWTRQCNDCGVIVSTHGTAKKEEPSG